MLFVVVLVGVLLLTTIPRLLTLVDRSRGLAAARYLASRMVFARARAVSRSAIVALQFQGSGKAVSFTMVEDGNRNGVRTQDILLQIDRAIEAPVHLSDLFPGVEIGLTPQSPGTDPVQLGGTDILSFTPAGTATSGSIYVRGRDGTQWVVRVLGSTARCRVLKFVPMTGEWINAF
jgi:type II secretory pathway pseudopilin PulG